MEDCEIDCECFDCDENWHCCELDCPEGGCPDCIVIEYE